jgi:outer membrane autotransporter protein
LHGFNSTIASLSGTGAVLNNGATAAALAVDNNNASTTFSGVLQDGTSALQLTKSGTGTLTLTGANTYSGGTTISAGTLQVGNGGATGSISGNVTDNGILAFDRSDAVTFGGVISATGSLVQLGNGTLTLTGNNTYSGGTTINVGTLQIGNGGASGSITGNVTDNGTLAFDRSDSVTFGEVISGTGTLVQMGSGTLTLTADNSYGGGTTINTGASLQLGNGGTTGSIIGNVTDNGSLIFNRSDNVAFNAIISGSGNLVQNGSGTTVLGGANTYAGGTIINNGTLLVNNSQALGLGNVVVNGGVLGADPQPINVKGNYTQNAGGTLQLQVAGANPGQYDTLNVGGNTALGGTLQLVFLGFQPNAGNQLTLVISGGTVSGRFARFVDPFSVRPGLNTIDLIFGKQSVVLEFLNQTTPVSPVIPTVPTVPTSPSVVPPIVIATINFASFALTPNQLAAANLLDAVQLNPRAVNLISFLDKVPFANLPSDFERISPDGLTAFYEISFSNANIQRLNLEGRMGDLHNGSTGFSSNMKVNGGTVNLENRADADGKSSKAVATPVLQPVPENRWGVWVTGFGDFVSVDADANANGYNFTTGGVSLGIDYRITDQLAIGVMGEYSHTWTTLQPGGNIDVNSGRGGMYATWSYHGIYLNAAIYGGYNSYDSSRSVLGGLARGNTEGAELSTFISGGYDFHFGPLTVGPIAALQYTYANVDGFSENGSLAPMQIQSDSVDSLRSDVGFRIFYQWQIGKILVEPSLKAAWEHEYLYSALPVTASFAGIPGPSATFFGPNEGHDSAIVSAGVSVQWTPMIATYVNYDGQLGRGNYDSNAVTGGVRISF